MKGQPLTILLVEDNYDHAELVRRSLEGHRIANRLYHVPDGETALDYLNQRGEYSDPAKSPVPHLILLDLRLPKMDGLEVLREIKGSEKLRKALVVVLTSSSSETDLDMAYENLANSYLVKPVDFEKFSKLLDDLGFYWLAWNKHPWQQSG
jgi:CheY-like chemotaxis protein